jgi:hypothetical protein
MVIIGCDFHRRYQQIAMARGETAEMIVERRLDHASGEARAFYRSLQGSPEPVRVGIEATGPIHWFERLLTELGHELWIGDSRRFVQAKCANRKPMSATPGSFSIFCSRSAFRKSGFPHRPNAISGSCFGTATSS